MANAAAVPGTPLTNFNARELYDTWRVKLVFREKLCGGIPRNAETIKSWVESKTGFKDEKAEEMTKEAIEAMKEQLTESSWNGFKQDVAHGLYIEPRQVKAMLRESCTTLGIFKKQRGSKQIYQHGLEVKGVQHEQPSRIYLDRLKPDGQDEGPIHIMTAQGPRSALKRLDYVEKAVIEFDLWRYKTHANETRHISHDNFVRILTFAQENGLGADRSQGHGKFDIIEFQQV